MDESKIADQFSNKDNIYYGHGTGGESQEIINSIFKHGLRCSHGQLYYTTILLGEGSDTLFKDNEELLNNWPHKASTQIIIASTPKGWHLIDQGLLSGMGDSAFYCYITQEEASGLGLITGQGYYLKPEFVRGVYDANNKSFTQNDRYFENLPPGEQKRLFDEVKKKYINILKGSQLRIEEYAQILKEVWNADIPLTPEEIAQADREVFESDDLESQLQYIVENARKGDFNQTTQEIKESFQQERDEESEYTDGGWSLDDW